MEGFKNFKVCTYIRAYDIEAMTDDQIEAHLYKFQSKIHLDKIYIENHRGLSTISVPRMRAVKSIFERNGIETAGAITCTTLVNGIRKPAIFDTYCYTDPTHREECIRLFCELAEIFDEIILDDFFFTSCRCEMCINAKGKRSWKQYRLDLMEDFSKEAVREVKKINPKLKFVIKYPNWYESYQECGYNPGRQKNIFDGIYTGTETRTPYSQQHLQRYESFSIMRLMEHTAPGRNGGGWIDYFGGENKPSVIVEQAQSTIYGKAKELMLWNFVGFESQESLSVLGQSLYKIDADVSKFGEPVGVKTWEPFDGDGEDQLYNYMGMCGVAVDPSPYFDEKATTVLFTESTAEDRNSYEKLEAFVRKGGNAIVTIGYFKKVYEQIKDMTSVRLTGRHVLGKRYMIQNANSFNTVMNVYGQEKILFEIISYKTNATHSDISLVADEHNFPVMTEDNYGRGRLFILNVPENFADLYKLPAEVIRNMNKHISMGQEVYIGGNPKFGFYPFDNNTYALVSYKEEEDTVQVIVRGECQGIRNLENGDMITESVLMPTPNHMGDATTVIEEANEYGFSVELKPEQTYLFEVVR